MAKSKLYEYAVLHHPKEKKDEETPKSTILTEVTRVLAVSADAVSILAARTIPETHLDKLEEVEIIVRPFN